MPNIKLVFDEPVHGPWNGGPRTGAIFTPSIWKDHTWVPASREKEHPGPGHSILWEAWELNLWFTAGSGRSWRQAVAYAKRRLRRLCRVPCTIVID